MSVSYIDISIILGFFILIVAIGFFVSKLASKNISSYFLGGKKLPWYVLGISNASGMFDIAGTMWMVTNMFIYGAKSLYIVWIWPVFNQIFLMVFMSAWVRRSNVMTGAEWIKTRYGSTKMSEATNILIVVFAIIASVGYFAYAFAGIGKFAEAFLPWDLAFNIGGFHVQNFQAYAVIITFITGLYAVKGGLPSVVITEVIQFVVMTVSCFMVAVIAINMTNHDQIMALVPSGWDSMVIHWKIDLNWKNLIPELNTKILTDGYAWFTIIVMMMLFKGILNSIAGPIPSYDMQRILATKSPVEASKMSGVVSAVLLVPRYLLISGLTVLALVYLSPHLRTGAGIDFEQILPLSLKYCIPVGVTGILLAGLISAFMSTYTANVNAPPAYIVNDIYKKYFRPDKPEKHYVRVSCLVSFIFLIVGIISGLFLQTINAGMQWLFAGLFGGYAAPNVLKWIWWRFNCAGYFWGMLFGLIASVLMPILFPNLDALYAFPFIFLFSFIGCIIGTYFSKADSMEVLVEFYKHVRPWGFWGPVKEKLAEGGLIFETHFRRDIFNCIVGTVWQTCLMALGLYIVIREYASLAICAVLIIITSIILKFNWWDKLED